MKVVNQQSKSVVEGVECKKFGIVFDRSMVNILSNQLYEDKILAIVRELSTNAYDSHVENGNDDKPFEVFLPSWDNPTFYIRDFGTGLSPDRIDNIYRMYGASDRSDSNEFVGCMGLGSKSPFCYNTKSFTVDSWYNGIHYNYACFLDNDGMPQIAKMSEVASKEPSGVKITVAVKSGDSYEFENAVQRIYKHFSTTPKILGRKVTVKPISYTLIDKDNNWKYAEEEKHNGMHIVMGNVAYRVSESALGELTRYQRNVIKSPFYVFADIGEINVTASREGLDYNNRTKTHVRKYINDIILTFNSKIQSNIDKCKNLWEARKKYVEIEKQDKSGLLDPTKILYNGTALFDNGLNVVQFNDMIDNEEVEIHSFVHTDYRNPEKKRVNSIKPSSSFLLYFNDLKTGAFVRANHICKTQKTNVLVVNFKQSVEKRFYDKLGLDASYFSPISTVPSPTVRVGFKRGKLTKVAKYKHNEYLYNTISSYWGDAEVNLKKDSGVYVEFNRYNIRDKRGVMVQPCAISSIFKNLDSLNIDLPVVYGVKTSHIKDLNSNWINFYDWLTEKVENKLKSFDLEYILACKQSEKEAFSMYSNRLSYEKLLQIESYCNEESVFTSFVKVTKAQHVSSDVSLASSCLDYLRLICDLKIPKSTLKAVNVRKLEDEIYVRYPLLSILESNLSRSNCENVAKYIDLMS